MELTEREKEQLKIANALQEFYNYLDNKKISLEDVENKEHEK